MRVYLYQLRVQLRLKLIHSVQDKKHYYMIWWCVSLPEQRAVGIDSGSAPGKGRRYREVVHAQ